VPAWCWPDRSRTHERQHPHDRRRHRHHAVRRRAGFGTVGGAASAHAYDRGFALLAVLAVIGAAAGLLVPGGAPAAGKRPTAPAAALTNPHPTQGARP